MTAKPEPRLQFPPPWLEDGYGHIWMPYTQMQTAPEPLPVVATEGTRIILADGRELIDGVASWWSACHGYNHPHIQGAVSAQLMEMPHVMLAGLAKTKEIMQGAGCTIDTFNGDSLCIKCEGGPTCLTRPLLRK